MTAACQRCRFWESRDPSQTHGDCYGYCHRFPPILYSNDVLNFPITRSLTWCGEFRVRVPIATAANPYPFVTDTTPTTNT